ncbi:MAG: hypothetical protein GY866_13600, partial [Proteobacteria bacterium]|nr:hypothetical protein [Pseudomonadota bacterium]
MNSKKPLITEVNHASIRIPAFLKERLNPDLTRYDLSREADLGVETIYNFDDTLDFIVTDISRVVLDTNRAKNGDFNGNGTFPLFIAARDVERYPDGKKRVYRRGGEPTKEEKT